MTDDQKNKIEKYHFDEIILILLILVTDLSGYSRGDRSNFSEAIEGEIDILFHRDFLLSLDKKYGVSNDMIPDFERLIALVENLYESQWTLKLATKHPEIEKIRIIASRLLDDLKITYTEPIKFVEDHFEIDW